MERLPGEGEVERPERPPPLTDPERLLIQDSWAKVFQDRDQVGVAILLRFFGDFPSSKKFFSQFKQVEKVEELEQSAQFRGHARRVMNAINTLVQNLDNAEKITSTLKQLSHAHALRHKVDPVYFRILNGVILQVLAEVYPDVVTPEVGASWTKLLATVYFCVTSFYRDLDWLEPST